MNETERVVQPKFSILQLSLLISLPFLLLCAAEWLKGLSDRLPQPTRPAHVRFSTLAMESVAGAWVVEVADPRFGGVSAMASRGQRLLALTDAGVLISLPKPGTGRTALLSDLPAGPGEPTVKRARDSESLARDPWSGRWWVGFENRHSLWAFDPAFRRAVRTIDLRNRRWPVNKGAEALVALPDGALLLLPELGRSTLTITTDGVREKPLAGAGGQIADAARLPDGRVFVLVRRLGLTGLSGRIAELQRGEGSDRLRPVRDLPTGPLTNLEAMTAEPLPSGGTRLWLLSDNDFSAWRRTILIAIDLPALHG